MKKILVTGGAGYIGTMLITKLLEKNFSVTCVDKLVFGSDPLNHLFFHKNFIFIKGDIRNKPFFTKVLTYQFTVPREENPNVFIISAYVGACP